MVVKMLPSAPLKTPKVKKARSFVKINAMGKDKVAVLNSYLISGDYSFTDVAKMIKDDWGEFKDSDHASLRRTLVRYKKEVIKPKQVALVSKITGEKGLKDIEVVQRRLSESLDVVTEFESLIALQTARVRKMHDTEEKLPNSLLDAQTKAITLLTDQLTRFAHLQMDLGIIHKTPDKVLIGGKVLVEEERAFMKTVELQQQSSGAVSDALRYLASKKALVSKNPLPPKPEEDDEEDAELEPPPDEEGPNEYREELEKEDP